MRLLAGMGPYMDGQSTALDEAFIAVAPGADVGTVIGMYAEMPDEVGFAIELLPSCGEQVSTRDGSGQVCTREQLPLGRMARSRGTPWYVVEGQRQRLGDQQPCLKTTWGRDRLSRVSAVKADSVDD